MWAKTLTITNADTNYRLGTLMAAADANAPMALAQLTIQFDIGAGGARLYIGNPSSMSGTDRGEELLATGLKTWGPFNMNIISPNDVWVRSNTAGVKINVNGWTI